MKHELIKTDYHLLVVSDEDIKEGDWFVNTVQNELYCNNIENDDVNKDYLKKVIAHLSINNSPILKGVDLLPPLNERVCNCGLKESEHNVRHPFIPQDDVDELAKMEWKTYKERTDFPPHMYHIGFKEGYNKAKENLFTEEQVKKAYFKGAADVHDKCTDRTWRGVETRVDIKLLKKLNAEYIQSLQQPKHPIAFECVCITMNKGYTEKSDYPYQEVEIPKTITNSQGQTEWVGKYIYN